MKNDFFDFNNHQVANLPSRLRQFVVAQDYPKYTPVDHAVWRYVMRKNIAYLSKVADTSYLKGLEKTGITVERIPNIQDMNDILGKIGWGCVCYTIRMWIGLRLYSQCNIVVLIVVYIIDIIGLFIYCFGFVLDYKLCMI